MCVKLEWNSMNGSSIGSGCDSDANSRKMNINGESLTTSAATYTHSVEIGSVNVYHSLVCELNVTTLLGSSTCVSSHMAHTTRYAISRPKFIVKQHRPISLTLNTKQKMLMAKHTTYAPSIPHQIVCFLFTFTHSSRILQEMLIGLVHLLLLMLFDCVSTHFHLSLNVCFQIWWITFNAQSMCTHFPHV